ncbi:hypothetical protein G9A89_005656 [Geosiphon pyriformis]|nr:hypothetical protein G9A89_005656 [Geosiphon pyriformis]
MTLPPFSSGDFHYTELEFKDIVIDERHPFYIGDWKKAIAFIDDDFAMDDLDEPHLKRGITIFKQHPEIEKLYGYEPKTLPITIFATIFQLSAAYTFGKVFNNCDWILLIYAYIIGGSTSQLFGVIIHEAAHGLAASTQFQNRIVGLLANISIPFPIAMLFRRYHLDHHRFTGVVGIDLDLPLEWEKKFIRGNAFLKFLWVTFYPAICSWRTVKHLRSPQYWEYINAVFTATSNIIIFFLCGSRGFFFLLISSWFGYGLHPAAAHYIQEHFTFDDGQETYSYYGNLNKLLMNIGYHNEHHDFTQYIGILLRKDNLVHKAASLEPSVITKGEEKCLET